MQRCFFNSPRRLYFVVQSVNTWSPLVQLLCLNHERTLFIPKSVWLKEGEMYTCFFAMCYFRPFVLANGFALSWIHQDIVVFQKKCIMGYWKLPADKEVERGVCKRADISLYKGIRQSSISKTIYIINLTLDTINLKKLLKNTFDEKHISLPVSIRTTTQFGKLGKLWS